MFLEEKREGEVEVKLEPWRQWCLDAAQYIREHGWIQGREYDENGVCMDGALRRTEPEAGATEHLWNRLDAAFNYQLFGANYGKFHASFIYYNDRCGQTASQVIDMLERMAKQGRK